jgi:hypothetical protein
VKKLITILLTIITTNLSAATFLYDDLTTNYVDGNLVGQNGWTQTATASNNPIQYFSGKVVVGSTGQDVWKSLTTQITKANSGTGSLTVWGSSVYNLNELLSVVIAWDMVGGALNDTFSLYVNPLTNDRTLLTAEITSNWNSTTGAEPALTISALNLRQGSTTTAPTTYVEELWVGDSLADVGITTIPEPSASSLILIGCGSLIILRRLKRNGR